MTDASVVRQSSDPGVSTPTTVQRGRAFLPRALLLLLSLVVFWITPRLLRDTARLQHLAATGVVAANHTVVVTTTPGGNHTSTAHQNVTAAKLLHAGSNNRSNLLLSSSAQNDGDDDDVMREEGKRMFVIHTLYDDLRYRRVCAPVYAATSYLCLTIRYPFPIPVQDPSVSYPKPVQELFYANNTSVNVHFVDGAEREACHSQTARANNATTSIGTTSIAVKQCLDLHHPTPSDNTPVATAVWSRIRNNGRTELFGIDSVAQRRRAHTLFHHRVLLVMGASPHPPIAASLQQLFDVCQNIDSWFSEHATGLRRGQKLCRPASSDQQRLTGWDALAQTDEDWTLVLQQWFLPNADRSKYQNHSIPDHLSVLPELEKIKNVSNWDTMKFTVLIEHPIAHFQNQELMQLSYDYSVSLQNKWTEVFLNATRGSLHETAQARGLEFDLIAFDGAPQFFPTESGAHSYKLKKLSSQEIFRAAGGYEGWTPDMGTNCRGFLPPTSDLTKFNALGRKFYEQNGLDMRWYGRTWEFINMVWFAMWGWTTSGIRKLDCTHGGPPVSQMHKFFLMAMIDEHYDMSPRAELS